MHFANIPKISRCEFFAAKELHRGTRRYEEAVEYLDTLSVRTQKDCEDYHDLGGIYIYNQRELCRLTNLY